MKLIACIAIAASALTICGCASNSANMRVGTGQSYESLRDQRESALVVREYAAMPEGAERIGTVDAARCHRNTLQAEPSEPDVLADLKAAAYAKGADGIMEIRYSKSSGLLQNCWNILNGTAVAFAVRK